MCNWSLSLGMLQKQIQLLTLFLIVSTCVQGQETEPVFAFNNPFYEDCQLVDLQTHLYIKSNGIKYLRKTAKTGNETDRVTEYFYNERADLDSVIDVCGPIQKKLSIYKYDSLFRLTMKIDSFISKSGWDSVYRKNWTYKPSGEILHIQEGWSYFDQPGFKRFKFMPQIVYDTMIGDMTRYEMIGPLLDVYGNALHDENPNYLWLREGELVLKGTDSLYTSSEFTDIGEEFELRQFLYRGDSATLMRISRYDVLMQIKACKVFYENEWVLLEDHRYNNVTGSELMKTIYNPVTGIKSTTTFLRDRSDGRIEKELSPITVDSENGKSPRVYVTEVTYFYSK